MSGHAGVQLLERRFEYSYSESSRKIVRGDDYGAYWAAKRAYFDGVLAAAMPAMQQLDAQLVAANFPISLIDPAREHSLELELAGDRGTTTLRFQLASPLTEAQRAQLRDLVAPLDFALLAQTWERAGQPPAKAGQFVRAVAMASPFPSYALALFLIRQMRHEVADELRPKLAVRLNQLAEHIEQPMVEKIARGQLWVDPHALVSFAENFGSTWRETLLEQDPAKSVFNPYGPLHDARGRRTSTQAGLVTAVMLFLNKNATWAESEYSRNTADFEQWFREAVRY